MTITTELAQREDLVIANGWETVQLLHSLSENEIDSDWFGVISECESYGTELDAEFVITEFALRAAGHVKALLDALEAKDKLIADATELTELQRDKIKRLETDLFNEEQLRRVHSSKSFELESENRELKARNDKDFVWRGNEISRLNDELDEAKERIAELEARTEQKPVADISRLDDVLSWIESLPVPTKSATANYCRLKNFIADFRANAQPAPAPIAVKLPNCVDDLHGVGPVMSADAVVAMLELAGIKIAEGE